MRVLRLTGINAGSSSLPLDALLAGRLLALCEASRTPIVEDGFDEEMKYFGRAVLPVKSMDTQGIVLYVGTFSKVMFPGRRVGWIAAPRGAIMRLTTIQYGSMLSGNTLAQIAAAQFARGGSYELYLRRVHRIYRSRMQAMLRGLAKHLPADAGWTKPVGGCTLCLHLSRKGLDETSWLERFHEVGVRVAPGSRFFGRPPRSPLFRLSIACVDKDRIAEGW